MARYILFSNSHFLWVYNCLIEDENLFIEKENHVEKTHLIIFIIILGINIDYLLGLFNYSFR